MTGLAVRGALFWPHFSQIQLGAKHPLHDVPPRMGSTRVPHFSKKWRRCAAIVSHRLSSAAIVKKYWNNWKIMQDRTSWTTHFTELDIYELRRSDVNPWFSRKSKVEPAEISRHERHERIAFNTVSKRFERPRNLQIMSHNTKVPLPQFSLLMKLRALNHAGMSSATKGTSFGIKPSFCIEASNKTCLKITHSN